MVPDPERQDAPTVKAAYDRIAEHFAETRAYPWPEVEAFLDEVPDGAVGLDVGCGNARHAGPLAERTDRVVGVDVSRDILAVAAAERSTDANIDLVQSSATALPLDDGYVDIGLYVATVHHLQRRADRVCSLDELARVLAPGACALVSAWCTEHDRFEPDEAFDTTIDWTLPDGETVPRFYHVYDPETFREDLYRSDLRVAADYVSSGNCYAEVKG